VRPRQLRPSRSAFLRGLLGVAAGALPLARAERTARAQSAEVDRVAVRFITPETGGAARPRFLTERELAFYARLEALFEQTPLDPGDYPERYLRTASDRLVARTMLSSLLVQRGIEPPELARQAHDARGELEARVGGASALAEVMRQEGILEEELDGFLRDVIRAMQYVDRAVTPILAVTEEALREAYRGMLHPFRGAKFDDIRTKLRLWLVTERFRSAELEFLQGARARIRVVAVIPPTTGPTETHGR
jgi:hypothetical protein